MWRENKDSKEIWFVFVIADNVASDNDLVIHVIAFILCL